LAGGGRRRSWASPSGQGEQALFERLEAGSVGAQELLQGAELGVLLGQALLAAREFLFQGPAVFTPRGLFHQRRSSEESIPTLA
jgi:hypothetical protein